MPKHCVSKFTATYRAFSLRQHGFLVTLALGLVCRASAGAFCDWLSFSLCIVLHYCIRIILISDHEFLSKLNDDDDDDRRDDDDDDDSNVQPGKTQRVSFRSKVIVRF